MNLNEYARALRHHDWTACMSDDGGVVRRARKRKTELSGLAKTSKNHQRLWELATAWHGNFMWNGKEPKVRWEKGWRWAGAYLWVHGIKLSEEEAQNLVFAVGETDKWGRDRLGHPKWEDIDTLIKDLQGEC